MHAALPHGRDVFAFPFQDHGDGWPIFDVAKADLGCHPAERPGHDISFSCDDLQATVAALKDRGVAFPEDIHDQGWGLTARFELPGVGPVTIFQPKDVPK